RGPARTRLVQKDDFPPPQAGPAEPPTAPAAQHLPGTRTGAPPLPRPADADLGAERIPDVDASDGSVGLERVRPRRLGRLPRGRVPQGAPDDRGDADPDRGLR